MDNGLNTNLEQAAANIRDTLDTTNEVIQAETASHFMYKKEILPVITVGMKDGQFITLVVLAARTI